MKVLPITLTGIDAKTDLSKLPKNCEIGILYTATPWDRNLYPTIEQIQQMVNYLALHQYRVALHVCGKKARKKLQNIELNDITNKVQRIQVNSVLKTDEIEGIFRKYPNHMIITQHDEKNTHLLEVQSKNHAILVDSSGGKGISPTSWTAPSHTEKAIGFAGGLSPDNIQEEYAKIKLVAKDGHWLDMQKKLRNEDDWFDVKKAIEVSEAIDILFQ